MSEKKRVLVVAGRTADSPELIAELRCRNLSAPAHLTLLVPAVPRGFAWAADMKSGWSGAIARAEAGAWCMRSAGLDLGGVVVGDPDPFAAVGDVLHGNDFDEVVVSTLPRSVSGRLRLSLAHRLRRAFPVPVTQITAHPLPDARGRRTEGLRRSSLEPVS